MRHRTGAGQTATGHRLCTYYRELNEWAFSSCCRQTPCFLVTSAVPEDSGSALGPCWDSAGGICVFSVLCWSWAELVLEFTKSLGCLRLHSCLSVSRSIMSDSVIPRTVAHQAPLSMGFSRQEYWSGLSFPSPGDLPNPGVRPWTLTLQAYSLLSQPQGKLVRAYLKLQKSSMSEGTWF